MQATEISNEWLKSLDFIDENGDGILDITEKARDFLNVVKSIGIALGAVIGLAVIKGIVNFGVNLLQWIVSPIGLATISITTLITGISMFIDSWKDMSAIERATTIIKSLVAGIVALRVSLKILKGNWLGALSVAGIVAGASLAVSSQLAKDTPQYATGGFPEDGLFFANSGEMVGQFSNGKTAVANNDQIVTGITQGVYNAMMAYNAQTRGQGGSGDVYLDGTKVGRVVAKGSHSEMVRVGLIKANS